MDPIDWCRQRLLVPGNPLTVTLPYADPSQRDRILVLRCMISEIAAVASVSDAEPGFRKLDWWRQALNEGSSHPAIQAWTASGLAGVVGASAFDPLIEAVMTTLESPRFEHRQQLWQHALRLGGPAWRLEGLLVGASDADELETLAELGATSYLVRIIRDLGLDARRQRWMAPLDLQAEYQVARQDALSERASTGWNGMVRALVEMVIRRQDDGEERLDPVQAWRHRHALVQSALDRRLALKLASRPQRILDGRYLSGPAGNAFTAWRKARQLARRQR